MLGTRTVLALMLVASSVALLPGTARAEAFVDQIQVRDDSPRGYRDVKDVEILSDTLDGITWKNKANRQETKPVGEIRAVIYGDAPKEWSEGLQQMSRGAFGDAVKSFQGAMTAHEVGKARAWVKEHGAYYVARAMALGGAKLDDALRAYQDFLEQSPKSRLRPEGLQGYAEALVRAENAGRARRQYEELRKLAEEKSLYATYRFDAMLGIARTYALEKNWPLAIPEYESAEQKAGQELRRASGHLKDTLEEARLQAASCLGDAMIAKAESSGRSQDFDQARTYFEGLPGRLGDGERARAISEIGVAVCMLRQGETRAALRRLSDAKVNYFPHREEVAKALYYMAKAADMLGHSQQAVVFLKELREYYPNSDWARRAD